MRKEFFRHAGRLFSWTITGQVVGLLSAPIVARLFDPESYGIAAMVLTAAGTIAIVSSFRYEQAIVIADNEQDAVELEYLCRNLIAFIGFISLVGCFFLYIFPPHAVVELFKSTRYLLFGIPAIAVLNGYALVRRRALNREMAYSQIGIAAFSNSVVVPISRILSGLIVQGNAMFLVIGGMLGWVTEVLQLRSKDPQGRVSRRCSPKSSLRLVARKYRDFPKFSLPEGLLSNVSIQLPIYTLGFIYSPAVTGLYAIAVRIVRLPVLALSTAVSQVLLRQFEEHRRAGGRLSMPVAKSSLGLFLVSSTIGLPIMIFAEPVFRVILGESWAMTGLYAAALVPWIIGDVSIIPTNLSFVILRRQGLWLLVHSGLFLLRIIIMASAAVFNIDALTTLWAFSLASAGYFFLTFIGGMGLLALDKRQTQSETGSIVRDDAKSNDNGWSD